MLVSMTGYGAAEGMCGGAFARVELKSVNSRYFDFSPRIPATLFPLEIDIKNIVREKVKRGKISLFIWISEDNGTSTSLVLNENELLSQLSAIKKFTKNNKISGTLTASDILTLPNAFIPKKRKLSMVRIKHDLFPVVKKALESFYSMKRAEGRNIEKDFNIRIKKIKDAVCVIEKKACSAPKELKKKIEARISTLDERIRKNPQRLAEEVAYYADKCDITEEIVRLMSHCDAFKKTMAAKGEAGKKLEFIVQEMHREINTIGSKTQDVSISNIVIDSKLELEKIREQIQNIE